MDKYRKLFVQILKFGFVGASAFVIDFAVLWVLTEFLGVHYLISNVISFTVSVIYNYILSVYWVFDATANHKKSTELIVFITLSVIGLGINQLIYWICVEFAGIHYLISKIIATAIVMVYNFITRKIFLEK